MTQKLNYVWAPALKNDPSCPFEGFFFEKREAPCDDNRAILFSCPVGSSVIEINFLLPSSDFLSMNFFLLPSASCETRYLTILLENKRITKFMRQ